MAVESKHIIKKNTKKIILALNKNADVYSLRCKSQYKLSNKKILKATKHERIAYFIIFATNANFV